VADKIRFTYGATVWTASCFREYPVHDPDEANVVVDYTDGNQAYAYDKGPVVRHFSLVFDKLSAADAAALRSFYLDVRGPLRVFTYTDESGVDHQVRWMDLRYPISQRKHGHFGGTITLREEV